VFAGGEQVTEFYAGWLTEYRLSVDNLFVFVIIMARFRVPRQLQQEALMIGILGRSRGCRRLRPGCRSR
jgi:tellurite resistance protein TerC